MSAEPPLPLLPADAVPVGDVAGLVTDAQGGKVLLRGVMVYSWDADDQAMRRLAAVQLVLIGAASVKDVAAAWEVTPGTLRRWRKRYEVGGVAGLVPDRRAPRGPS